MSKIRALLKSGLKFTKNPLRYLLRNNALIVPNVIALEPNNVREKRYKIFYTLQYFGASGGPSVSKCTNLRTDVQQGPANSELNFVPF